MVYAPSMMDEENYLSEIAEVPNWADLCGTKDNNRFVFTFDSFLGNVVTEKPHIWAVFNDVDEE